MFLVLLKSSDNVDHAARFLEDHQAWIEKGFDDSVFLVVGTLEPRAGGGILAHNTTLSELRHRVDQDPFVDQKVVDVEILELTPSRTTEQLAFLRG
jgi:uncharacterized protein YciI